MLPSVLIAGHVCVDLTPGLHGSAPTDPGRLFDVGPMRVGLGGAVANTGFALADLGVRASLAGTVGDDDLGRIVERRIHEHPNLVASLDVRGDLATSYSVVLEPGGHDRTFWHHTGANAAFTGADLDLSGADLLHVGYPPLLPATLDGHGAPLAALFDRARRAGTTTSLDLAVVDPASAVGALDWTSILRTVASRTDVLTPSLDDLTSALRLDEHDPAATQHALAERLLEWGAGVVAISAGADGLLVRTAAADRLRAGGRVLAPLADAWADATVRVPPAPVARTVTTNGAGDASTAGMLAGLVRGLSPLETAHLAARTAAAVIEGGRPRA